MLFIEVRSAISLADDSKIQNLSNDNYQIVIYKLKYLINHHRFVC